MAEARLGPQPWMGASATGSVMAALAAAGGGDCARFVGGCVRNTVLDRPIDDIDIATILTPDAVMRALTDAGVKWVPTGVEHGTVTAIAEGRPFEITTLRRDVATDGRRAVVAFTTDWREDAQRRDFRLNALYLDTEGALYDPVGEGLSDARAGRIVFVGDPEARIREDHLRFFRFQAWYGRGEPDAAAVEACAALKGQMADLAAERITKELLKLLAAADPTPVVRLMHATGVLSEILPGVASLARFEGLVRIETEILQRADEELRLAALLTHDAVAGTRRLRLSNAQRDRLAAALAAEPAVGPELGPRTARPAIYRLGEKTFRDRVELAWAVAGNAEPSEPWLGLLAQGRDWTRPVFPLTGQDAMAAGLPKGPLIGQALKTVEDWWAAADFPADPAVAHAQLHRFAQSKR